MALVDKGVSRHDLDAGDAESDEMRDGGGMGEAGESSAPRLGDIGMEPGKAAQVELINDRFGPRNARASGLSAGRIGADDAFRRDGGAVGAGFEHCSIEIERTIESEGVRISEQL